MTISLERFQSLGFRITSVAELIRSPTMIRLLATRLFLASMVVAALVVPAHAADVYMGKVVTAGDGALVIVEKDGDNEEFVVPQGTKITLDGKPAKLADLEAGDLVKVTAETKQGKLTASAIEGRSAE
jgi:hypothetical protein